MNTGDTDTTKIIASTGGSLGIVLLVLELLYVCKYAFNAWLLIQLEEVHGYEMPIASKGSKGDEEQPSGPSTSLSASRGKSVKHSAARTKSIISSVSSPPPSPPLSPPPFDEAEVEVVVLNELGGEVALLALLLKTEDAAMRNMLYQRSLLKGPRRVQKAFIKLETDTHLELERKVLREEEVDPALLHQLRVVSFETSAAYRTAHHPWYDAVRKFLMNRSAARGLTLDRLHVRTSYTCKRFAPHAPYWQFIIWLRSFGMTVVTLLPAMHAAASGEVEVDFLRGNADTMLMLQVQGNAPNQAASTPSFPLRRRTRPPRIYFIKSLPFCCAGSYCHRGAVALRRPSLESHALPLRLPELVRAQIDA